ncbi:hypothetical protein [Bacteroides helcogenes]|uniref:Uncharacterized protein n=1 Tax=Bacteroides helcogenes (strain ATCC 35417 / DSM 20613 / JCM 6297 / CCUG 15421 / P 36-108) TaxID=693979 RepID=E6SW10_BACT6|nr:hypothetical protein [Bacteroides helcogenes]ADV42535.1 hypothetical protein Bache_0510 [Bacteroides helcogenes P 36-108]MDY5237703.1 hypothetical protein [Bacteroides helcogenes]
MGFTPEILNEYFDGKLAEEERKQVLAWLLTEEGQAFLSRHIDEDMLRLTDASDEVSSDYPIPTERMKKRFINKILGHFGGPFSASQKKK